MKNSNPLRRACFITKCMVVHPCQSRQLFRSSTCIMLYAFLRGRIYQVRVNCVMTRQYPVDSGVPHCNLAIRGVKPNIAILPTTPNFLATLCFVFTILLMFLKRWSHGQNPACSPWMEINALAFIQVFTILPMLVIVMQLIQAVNKQTDLSVVITSDLKLEVQIPT